jgi:hypothetical protein
MQKFGRLFMNQMLALKNHGLKADIQPAIRSNNCPFI